MCLAENRKKKENRKTAYLLLADIAASSSSEILINFNIPPSRNSPCLYLFPYPRFWPTC